MGVTCESHGSHVVFLAPPPDFFAIAAGITPTFSGRLLICGKTPDIALSERLVAGAPLDPPLPPDETPAFYLTAAAKLTGLNRSQARTATVEALERFQLVALAQTKLKLLR
jgi:ABC-type multidrug transport system ATPase subunit